MYTILVLSSSLKLINGVSDGLAKLSGGGKWRTAKDGVCLLELGVIDVEGISSTSIGSWTTFSVD